MKKIRELCDQIEAEIKSRTRRTEMTDFLVDFADRLYLEALNIKPADFKIVRVGIHRGEVAWCLGRTPSNVEWTVIANEIGHSEKLWELCHNVILAYVTNLNDHHEKHVDTIY